MSFPLQFLLETVIRNTLMAKGKKKSPKKGKHKDELSEDILDVAALSVKKFRKVTKEISKLSTGQKLVGGVALLAAGLTYLATQQDEPKGPLGSRLRALASGGATAEPLDEPQDEPKAEELTEELVAAEELPRKTRKPHKSKA